MNRYAVQRIDRESYETICIKYAGVLGDQVMQLVMTAAGKHKCQGG